MDNVIKNLYTLFDVAWEENMNGRGTDITRMVTTFVPDAIQNLQAYEAMFKCNEEANKNRYCLFCNHSMSADAPDGSQVLVCFECEGYEGKEVIVGDDECCKNYST